MGREAGFLQHFAELDREFCIAQLGCRNIDRQGDVAPAQCITHRLTQHPQAERVDQARILGHRHKDIGAERGAIAPVPAQQRLDRDDPRVIGADQRLIGEVEFARGDAGGNLVLDLTQAFAAAVEAFVEPGAAHLPAALGHVHRHIGAAQHFGRGHAVVGQRAGQTDARADRDLAVTERDRGAEPFEQRAAHPLKDGP